MSAPTLASQNGDNACFTDTAAEPFGLSWDDRDVSLPAPAGGATRAFDAGLIRVEASTLSWLQSRFLMSTSVISTSLISKAASASAAAASGFCSTGTACAASCSVDAKPMLAARISSTARRYRVLEVITPAH